MFLKEPPTQTLTELRNKIEVVPQGEDVQNTRMRVDLVEENSITLDDEVVPATPTGIAALGDWLDIPAKWLTRADRELAGIVLNHTLEHNPAVARVFYDESGVIMVRDPELKFIDPRRLVDTAMNAIDPMALVAEHWLTKDDFRLDVIAPEGFDRGIGGDPQIDDITHGGVRIGMDIKHNLAPWVSEFMYRLWCTNGMEREDQSLKVDARGQTVDEVLAELDAMADRAFRRVEETIDSFYEMRNEPVDNPERTVIRMAEEQSLPSRTVLTLAERVPTMTDDDGNMSMFDLVNLFTNAANDPSVKAGPARTLQTAGGHMVADHVDRCGHCQSRLN